MRLVSCSTYRLKAPFLFHLPPSQDLGTLNVHFMDEEEDAVIKLHELSQALGSASTMEQLQPIKGRLVKLHGM